VKFTVIWMPEPEAKLVDLWITASDRDEVEEAANWIDRQLRINPLNKLTRVDDVYFLRRDPLTVLCKVDVGDRMVSIIDVHRREH
jgi:hypothetical protein